MDWILYKNVCRHVYRLVRCDGIREQSAICPKLGCALPETGLIPNKEKFINIISVNN